MDITQESGIFNMDDTPFTLTSVKRRHRNTKVSDADTSSPSNVLPSPPPLTPFGLKRELAQYKWESGIRLFNKLYNEYKVYMLFICLSPIYTISYNVSIIQYFTRHEFYWYGLCVPLLIPLVLYVFCKWYLFKTSNSISTTQFTSYPGYGYDYGVIISNVYDTNDKKKISHQYWVAHNSSTKEMDCICVINGDYLIPQKHNFVELNFE